MSDPHLSVKPAWAALSRSAEAKDWRHLTSSFTFGGDFETKAELDEIIRQSLALWP